MSFGGHYKYETHLKLTGTTKQYFLPYRLNDFLKDYEEKGWQSYSVSEQKTYNYFAKLAKEGKLPVKEEDVP